MPELLVGSPFEGKINLLPNTSIIPFPQPDTSIENLVNYEKGTKAEKKMTQEGNHIITVLECCN